MNFDCAVAGLNSDKTLDFFCIDLSDILSVAADNPSKYGMNAKLKLDWLKSMSTCEKVNAIWSNIKINLDIICWYELTINL